MLIIINALNLRLLGIVMIVRWGMFGSSKKRVQYLPLYSDIYMVAERQV